MGYVDAVIIILLVLSLISFALAVIGVIRFPEFYTRVHAASKGDSLSTMLMLVAVIIYVLKVEHGSLSSYLTSIKVFFVLAFMFFTGPTGLHALINAGYEAGKDPLDKKSDIKTNDDEESDKNNSKNDKDKKSI
ncbi:MAG: monovalent cation/H(+) antiporter subunit G [Bdellovibrionota bacterium]